MKTNLVRNLAIGFYVWSLLFVNGRADAIFNWFQAKYEKTVQQRAPVEPNSTVKAESDFGSIAMVGADVSDCNLVATISVRAPTEKEARQLAEQVKIKLEPAGKTLIIRAEKPSLRRNRSISVSFNITMPRQTNAECTSSYGSIQATNLDGNLKGKTSSGSIKTQNIQGPVQLDTSYGSVTCRNVTGPRFCLRLPLRLPTQVGAAGQEDTGAGESIKLKSSSGPLTAENVKGPVSLETSYGSIACKNISDGDIKLKSSSGKITLSKASFSDCDARTSYGSVVCDELKGNSINLHSDSGSVNVTTASASTIAVSTSYGRINCQEITTGDLTAKSGSGNIDIACSQSTPLEIAAEVATSYGSIDFASPPDFSGQVDLKTSYGSIRTDLLITIAGEITKKRIQGKIGDGKGKLCLQTSSGSIKIK